MRPTYLPRLVPGSFGSRTIPCRVDPSGRCFQVHRVLRVRALRILLRAPHPGLLHVGYMKSFERGLSPPYLPMPVSKAPIREQVLAGPIDRMGVLRVRRVRSIHPLARTALQASACRAHAIYRGLLHPLFW